MRNIFCSKNQCILLLQAELNIVFYVSEILKLFDKFPELRCNKIGFCIDFFLMALENYSILDIRIIHVKLVFVSEDIKLKSNCMCVYCFFHRCQEIR